MEKKAFERPETGVFYLVPDPKIGKYSIRSHYDSDNDGQSAHLMLWDTIIKILSLKFKGKFVDGLEQDYTGIPRGRIVESGTNMWTVQHGNDFPLKEYKSDIVSEFKLYDAEAIGKVSWEFNSHETMAPREKKNVERTLGITITPAGFKKTTKVSQIADEIARTKYGKELIR